MKLPRRQFLHLAAGAAALPFAPRVARAQAYPTRPVRFVVGFPPGGISDIVARLIAQSLSERLDQPFFVENRPGAASNIATEAVVRAAADGHTLLMIGSANTTSANLYNNLNFNFIRDIAPVAGLIRVPNLMAVNLAVPARTVPEFIAYAKLNPGKINFASPGNGTTAHIGGELFKMMAGVDMVHVPYRGTALALTDLIGGQVQVMLDNLPPFIEHVRTGKVRALAVTTATKSEALPEVPTVGEFVSGFEVSVWQGVGAPKNTPAEIIDKVNQAINTALAEPEIKARLAGLGGSPLVLSPVEVSKLIADETEK